MAKKDPESTSVVAKPVIPSYLQDRKGDYKPSGTDLITSELEAMPNVKIIQGLTAEELKDAHGEGSVVLMPLGQPIAAKGEPFWIIPLFFFPTWEKWSDVNDSTREMVLDQSYDRNSQLAKLSRNPATRNVDYDDGSKMSFEHVEVLNFFVYVETTPGQMGDIAILRLAGGEHYTGRRLNSLIRSRERRYRADIFCNRFQMQSTLRQPGGNRKWWGPDPKDPDNENTWFVTDEMRETFEGLHTGFRKQYEQGLIQVSADPDDGTSVGNAVADQPPFEPPSADVGDGPDEVPV